jgi:hypothetical protein
MPRITVDIDNNSIANLFYIMARGLYFLHRLPEFIRKTQKGYHLIYWGIDCNKRRSLILRKCMRDDENRIRLDMCGQGKRITQVLFREKTITIYGRIHPAWFGRVMHIKSPSKRFNICPFCHKRVLMSKNIWTDEEKAIKIWHTRNKKVCIFQLRRKIPIALNLFCKQAGIDIL